MKDKESKPNTYEKIRFAMQSVFILPFLPFLFLMMFVLDWADKKFPSKPGTSKARSFLFWLLFILICCACWIRLSDWLLSQMKHNQ
jgi:hypothetical protein